MPGMIVPGMRTNPGMFYGPKRVWLKNKQVPGLAMTRSIGDMAATTVGVIARPEITYFPNLTANDKFIVIASDGLWDRLTNFEIMSIIASQYYKTKDADGAVNHLTRESVDRWQREQGMVDDITIIVAFLNVGVK
jgi:serine/threonine protein phosphatase PrpC